ncbi:hypothetical protein IFM89_036974 [Coptis chinensis]|uniref:Uncharacterized protein n=1 Tax=Coptis chinensis TaxID=261450 RepID=A0A835H7J6_9MAGN|nr:hypothetical protein IFM89_036974 [Coptis chinensis]
MENGERVIEHKGVWRVLVENETIVGLRTQEELNDLIRNKVQVYWYVRMPQLHTSLHFHLTPIVMINGSSHRDLLLDSQNFMRSIPRAARTRRYLGCATGGSGEVE